MQHVTVVCLEEDRGDAVRRLQGLGTLHVANAPAAGGEPLQDAQRLVERYAAATAKLRTRAKGSATSPEEPADGLLARFETTTERLAAARERILAGHRALARLAPWGSFAREDIERLREAGYRVVLGQARLGGLPELPEGAVLQQISRVDSTVYFAVVAPVDLKLDFSDIPLPEQTDADTIEADVHAAENEIAEAERELDRLAGGLGILAAGQAWAESELAFVRTREGMDAEERLAWLQGYVPDRGLPGLLGTAQKAGWAVRHVPAALDDPNVPTLIDYDRFGILRVAKPLFDFIGIAPAYNENDVSVCVLLFLTLFFGMIIGDAAYGAIFLAAGIYGRAKVADPKKKAAMGLFILLSAAAFAWGALNGTWFAIPKPSLPVVMRGFSWFEGELGQKHIQWLCFLTAAIHLSFGRAWKAWAKRDISALGHVGWGLFIWGNFFTAVNLVVTPGSFPTTLGRRAVRRGDASDPALRHQVAGGRGSPQCPLQFRQQLRGRALLHPALRGWDSPATTSPPVSTAWGPWS